MPCSSELTPNGLIPLTWSPDNCAILQCRSDCLGAVLPSDQGGGELDCRVVRSQRVADIEAAVESSFYRANQPPMVRASYAQLLSLGIHTAPTGNGQQEVRVCVNGSLCGVTPALNQLIGQTRLEAHLVEIRNQLNLGPPGQPAFNENGRKSGRDDLRQAFEVASQ